MLTARFDGKLSRYHLSDAEFLGDIRFIRGTALPSTLSTTRDTGPPEAETILAELEDIGAPGEEEIEAELLLPSQSNAILADTWLGIMTGTCVGTRSTRVVARGLQMLDVDSQLFSTPAGLAALQGAMMIVPEGAKNEAIDIRKTVYELIARDRGLVPTRGGGQILFEADPEFPVAAVLRAAMPVVKETSERRRMFSQLVLDLRRRVEIGALRRMINPVSEGPAGAVGRFLFELHENGLEHGSRRLIWATHEGCANAASSKARCEQSGGVDRTTRRLS